MTVIYGLIGKKLSHSFSPTYFNKKFEGIGLDAEYRLFEMEDISRLPALLKKEDSLRGLNVTVPYKLAVLPLLDELDDIARQTKSVNTIQVTQKNNKTFLKGFNTDVIGFEQSLVPLLQKKDGQRALILGTGGSAQSVAYVLERQGIEFLRVSREPSEKNQIHYAQITKEIIDEHQLIVQATPLGMFPQVDDAPEIPFQYLTKKHLLYDLVYNPAETKFLKLGKKHGARIYNGMRMLEIQAEESWKIWTK